MRSLTRLALLASSLFCFLTGHELAGQMAGSPQSTATDPNYTLIVGDTIAFQVLDEADMGASLLVDKDGKIRPPLLDDIPIAGLTVRNAEAMLEKVYVEQEMLKRPQVRLNVISYAARIITILGAVRNPGKVGFAKEANTIDIVDAITQAGGFTPVARRDQVNVIRLNEAGAEQNFVVDVEAMMSGRRGSDKPREFALKPGDRVIIREKVF